MRAWIAGVLLIVFSSVYVVSSSLAGQTCVAGEYPFGLQWSPDNTTLIVRTGAGHYFLDTTALDSPPRILQQTGDGYLRFDPTGRYIHTGSQVVDARTLDVLIDFGEIANREFTPDGRYIIDNRERLWDITAAEVIFEDNDLDLSPSGRFLLTLDYDMPDLTYGLLDLTNFEAGVQPLDTNYGSGHFSRDESLLVRHGSAPTFELWDTNPVQLIAILQEAYDQLGRTQFTSDDRYLITNSSAVDGNVAISVWDSSTGELVARRDGAAYHVIHPTAPLIAYGTTTTFPGRYSPIYRRDGLHVWNFLTDEVIDLEAITPLVDQPLGVQWSPDGQMLIVMGQDHVVLWDIARLQTGEMPEMALPTSTDNMVSGYVELNAAGDRILTFLEPEHDPTASWATGYVSLWNVETGETLASFSTLWSGLFTFSPDDRYVGDWSREFRLYDARTGQLVWSAASNSQESLINGDWSLLVYRDSENTIWLHDFATGEDTIAMRFPEAEC